MAAKRNLAVVDLGAESGRVFLASYDGTRLAIQEMHRFPNRAVSILGHLYWNVPTLWQEILQGLRQARMAAGELHSVGIDGWGVDYGLLDASGQLLGLPFHYRDTRTESMMQRVFARVSRETLYSRTGIQFLPFNTLYQLAAHYQQQPGLFAYIDRLLMVPDLFHYWLSGERVGEYTNATTTQMWSVPQKRWCPELLDTLGIPAHILPPVVEPGTNLGPLLPELAEELGAGVRVIAPATHDTGSAIAAIPANDAAGWAYVSSGTWSLVGVELAQPVMSQESLDANFTNEGGVFGTTRYLKNVMGLWLLQECMRRWNRDGHMIDYDTLLADVDAVPPFASLIDPDDPRFLAPMDMPEAINAYLLEHGQARLTAPSAFARCIMESLVLRYREVFQQINRLTGATIQQVHVVGGGARNERLNQWLADALEVQVIAGPYEATARGNALMQLVGLGELRTLAEVRAVGRNTPVSVYTPRGDRKAQWDEAVGRFGKMVTS